jgi:hypothetical protein
MVILLIWSAIVTTLTNQTLTYQKCKDKECVVVVKDIGYSIELKK